MVRAAIELMREDLSRFTEVRQIARELHYSQFYFQRAFRRGTGITPGHYLSALRVQRAKEMLAETALPVVQVAMTVGYQSQAAFTKAFAERVGMTPGRFRRLVDDAAGRRLRDLSVDLDPPAAGVAACVVAPDGQDSGDRMCFLGEFPSGLPSGVPTAVSLTRTSTLVVPGRPDSRQVLAASYPMGSDVTDLLLGGPGALVGQGLTAGGSDEERLPEMVLRSPGAGDPPVLTAAPVVYLLGAEKFGAARLA